MSILIPTDSYFRSIRVFDFAVRSPRRVDAQTIVPRNTGTFASVILCTSRCFHAQAKAGNYFKINKRFPRKNYSYSFP